MPDTNANAIRIRYSFPGDGNTKLFPILWPYIDKGFINVSIQHDPRDETTEDISGQIRWISDSLIELPIAPPSGSTVFITRQTPFDKTLTTFHDGSTLLADYLNMVGTQLIHIVQESRDYTQQVHEYVGKAEGYLEQLEGLSVALAKAEAAAETAVDHSGQIMSLSIAVDDAPYGHMASGTYDRESGMLTLRVPQGPQGEHGRDGQDGANGRDGTDGKDGRDGNPGVVLDIQAGQIALEVDANGDLILFYADGAAPPDFSLDADGNLIWTL